MANKKIKANGKKKVEEKFVVELSGGADSSLACLYLIERGIAKENIFPIYVNYGQVYAIREQEMSFRIAKYLNLQKLYISNINLFTRRFDPFIPYRNLVISSLALNYAQSIKAIAVVNGSRGLVPTPDEDCTYRDSCAVFYVLFNNIVTYIKEEKENIIQLLPILTEKRQMKMMKDEVYSELNRFKFPLDYIWNCYFGVEKPCGSCKNCKELKSFKDRNCLMLLT